MKNLESRLRILTINCCSHILASLRQLPIVELSIVELRDQHIIDLMLDEKAIDLIIIAMLPYVIPQFFINQIRHRYPNLAMLSLQGPDAQANKASGFLRGEFTLSDQRIKEDCKILQELQEILPLAACLHTHKPQDYDLVSEVLLQIKDQLSNEHLNLDQVAQKLQMAPTRLARTLNKQFGVSFRQLLRQARIEEASKLLASHQYSVKEIAAQVGFADSHYFSRSFSQVMGYSPSEYRIHNYSPK